MVLMDDDNDGCKKKSIMIGQSILIDGSVSEMLLLKLRVS
jgi:hypothetical protein